MQFRVLSVWRKESSDGIFRFLHLSKRTNSGQVCLGVREKLVSVLKIYRRACFIAFVLFSETLGCVRRTFRRVSKLFLPPLKREMFLSLRTTCI